MSKKSSAALVVMLVLIIVGASYFLFIGSSSDSSDDTGGTDPTDPVDDIINPPPAPDPPPTTGTLRFYVMLDGKPVTGATCKADGKTATTSGGYATMELPFGSYTTTVTFSEHTKTKEVYIGSNGAHIEVNWVSDAPPAKGYIKIQTAVDGTLVPGQVEIWQSGVKVASGGSSLKFTVDEGSYTVKARFESTQTFTGTRTVTVRAGEMTYVTFDWDSGGGLIDFNIFSTGAGGTIGLGTLIILGVVAYILLMKPKIRI